MVVKKIINTDARKNDYNNPKRIAIRDTVVQGFILRIEPFGKSKYYYIDYRREGKRSSFKLGDASVLTAEEARELARIKLVDVIKGIPLVEPKKPDSWTVQEVFEEYKKSVIANHKTNNAENFIQKDFKDFLPKRCAELTLNDLTNWRNAEREKGKKASSINRASNAFFAMLRWAMNDDSFNVECPMVKKHIAKLYESDSEPIVRYLTADERKRLLNALDAREKDGEKDYLRTIVLLALNTGIRRGALLNLHWSDIDFQAQTIRLRRLTSKTDKTYYIPMNATVVKTLREWHDYCVKKKKSRSVFLFLGPRNKTMHDTRTSWRKLLEEVDIQNFRWHDLRHDFASQLVMAGVSILTVKELLTHTKIEQTLRYAHLAPDQKQEAVDRLDSLYE